MFDFKLAYKLKICLARIPQSIERTPILCSGCIGAENITEIDNIKENFQPLTIKRVAIPRYSQTAQ